MQYVYPAQCGEFNIPGAACCQVSLTPDETGVSSAIIDFANDVSQDVILSQMNGATYCRLRSLKQHALLGYTELYVLEGTSVSGISCQPDSVVITTQQGNAPTTSTISLDEHEKSVVTLIGSIAVRKITMDKGKQRIQFTYHYPGRLLVLGLGYPLEFAFLFFGLGCIAALGYTVQFFMLKYAAVRSVSFILYSVSQLLFLIDLFLMMVYFYTPFTSDDGLALYTAVLFFIDNIATLFSVAVTLRTVVQIAAPPDKVRYAIFGSLVLVHLVLAGANYGVIFAMYDSDAFQDYLMWYPLHVYWIIFMFMVNSIPLSMLCYHILSGRQPPTFENIKDTLIRHQKFAAYIAINIAVCFMYVAVEWQTNFDAESLGSDRNALAMEIFKWVAIVAHNVVQCWAIEYIRSVMDSTIIIANLRKGIRLNPDVE
jgi:hypothetical protein